MFAPKKLLIRSEERDTLMELALQKQGIIRILESWSFLFLNLTELTGNIFKCFPRMWVLTEVKDQFAGQLLVRYTPK